MSDVIPNDEQNVANRIAHSHAAIAGLLVVIGVAIALRIVGLGHQSFWYDEAFTLRVSHGPLSGIFERLAGSESTPPLYYVIVSGWRAIAGSGEVGVRLLSVVFGVALVPVTYVVGLRSSGPRAALIAAAFVATNPELIWMSQEARSYSLVVLLVASSAAVCLVLRDRFSSRLLLAWAALAVAAIATHYFALFVIGAQLIWIVIRFRRRCWWGIAVVGASVVALAPLALSQRSTSASLATGGQTLMTRLPAVPKKFFAGEMASEFDLWWLLGLTSLLLISGLVLAAVVSSPAERRRLGPLVAFAAAGLTIPVALALVGLDYVNARNLLPAWPLVLVVIAAGLSAARVGIAGLASAGVICAVGLFISISIMSNDTLQRDDWRAAATSLQQSNDSGAVILFEPPGGSVPLSLYLKTEPVGGNGVRTRRIAVVTLNRGSQWPVFTPPTPFKQSGSARSASITVSFFAAPDEVLITREQLRSDALAQGTLPPEAVFAGFRSSGR